MIALLAALAVAATPVPAAESAASCAREPVRVVEESTFTFPENAHPTRDRMRFLIDLGSDGRIRRIATVESSGDTVLDGIGAKAVGDIRFAAPTAGCVSASTVWSWYWRIPAEAIVAPPASPAPANAPATTGSAPAASASPAACAAPFVRPARFPLPLRREAPGTAFVDVSLDATAHVTGVHLAQSSGNQKTDYAATAAARNAGYVFERQPGCPPVATTYRLEMTFR